MKQLYGKLWVKCTAIALLIVFAVLLAASALGIAYLINYGAYADGGEQVRQIAEIIYYSRRTATAGRRCTPGPRTIRSRAIFSVIAMTRSPPTSTSNSRTKPPARSCSAPAH